LFLARELEPGDARPLAALSRIALLTGSAPDALKLALEAARLDPTEFEAACAVAIAAETVQHPDAFAAWRMAHALSPDDANVATELARSAAARNDYAFGINALERLRQYRERLDPALHLTLAWLLLAEGRTRDAALEARLVSALTPNDPAVAELWAAIDQTGSPVGNS
jgi:Flp pilus assembly protein TadD